MIIDCKSIAQDIKDKIKNIIAEDDYAPILHIYQVGDNPASNAYIKGKLRDCEEVGIEAELIKLSEEITEDGLNDKIQEDYNYENVDGIIVQLPLPKHIDPKNICIPDELDIDGFNSTSPFQPCTPLGVMKIFDSIGYDLDGKNVLVCGQSDIVGRPLVDMLIGRHCNVISVNSTGSYMKNTAYVTKLANDVDLKNNCLNITHQISYVPGIGTFVQEPKSESGKRKIPLTDSAGESFERLICQREALNDPGPEMDGYTSFLFLKRGTLSPKDKDSVKSIIESMIGAYHRETGDTLPKTTPHTFRHMFCTRLISAGMNVKSVQYLMGHANIRMTLDVYAEYNLPVTVDDFLRIANG